MKHTDWNDRRERLRLAARMVLMYLSPLILVGSVLMLLAAWQAVAS